jgi:hypothetical protein
MAAAAAAVLMAGEDGIICRNVQEWVCAGAVLA